MVHEQKKTSFMNHFFAATISVYRICAIHFLNFVLPWTWQYPFPVLSAQPALSDGPDKNSLDWSSSSANRLGARVIGFTDPKVTSSSKGETLKDTIMMVSNYADIIVIDRKSVV